MTSYLIKALKQGVLFKPFQRFTSPAEKCSFNILRGTAITINNYNNRLPVVEPGAVWWLMDYWLMELIVNHTLYHPLRWMWLISNNMPVDAIYKFSVSMPHNLFALVLLFYRIATVYHLYNHSDVMYDMKRIRRAQVKPLPTQGIFNLPHHICMVWEELAFDYSVSYTQRVNGLQHN